MFYDYEENVSCIFSQNLTFRKVSIYEKLLLNCKYQSKLLYEKIIFILETGIVTIGRPMFKLPCSGEISQFEECSEKTELNKQIIK